ncbi:nucleolar protein 10-like protein [Dinothrombium tinctorium]|uniref:Nucleolar protein 10-like protein n=1 Tax=Dinothrombium tinctorium TaxID=1965070 RepID=A0A3S3NXK8_9ACAR|nr:nucleolar protein 10-like protein [Dinothrombium tinctorium]RWS11113.1 nucleolar protein 10-like protein [Dinothrombium tinctorium]RWS11120.1 nucleolar protein 10-like protein [Dinothrombium tinctorium]
MQVSNVNDVKLYNLSSSKSLPEWLSDRKKRRMQQKDVELRRRIELIQDFKMPSVSNCIKVSRDGQYVMATGVYKPRVRCYDVQDLALKFERCFDAEVIKFEILSDDYTKMAFLQEDRYLEFHSQEGRYFRLRIPRFGHDLAYNRSNCDLYCVGDSPEIYRLNLEQGKFLSPYVSDSPSFNVCLSNEYHNLLVCGSEDGCIEAWDPRNDQKVAKLDCAASCLNVDSVNETMPSITSLAFKDGLHLAAGTSSGLILLYDIRSAKPYLVKDHLYGLPIKDIEFIADRDLVASMDSKIVKFWNRNSGDPFTSIQTQSDLNDLCLIPNTGMLFLANEAPQILTYFIPSIGTAPKWCSFLEHLVEEMEESNENNIYDDYKFVTMQELESLGLNHLIGTNLLRAHMHGFFIDIRLYHKAKAASDPFAYEEYKRKKIKEKMEAERGSRVKVNSKLPKVNRELALKLMESNEAKNKSKEEEQSLLKDERFKALFENPDFQVDESTEEYKLLLPMITKLNKKKGMKSDKERNEEEEEESELRFEIPQYFDEVNDKKDMNEFSESSESDDEEEIKTEKVQKNNQSKGKKNESTTKMYKLKEGKTITDLAMKKVKSNSKRESKMTLADRLKAYEDSDVRVKSRGVHGNCVITFKPKDERKERQNEKLKSHLEERSKVARSAKGIKGKIQFG